MTKTFHGLVCAAALSLWLLSPLWAQGEEFYCEVMAMEGTANLIGGSEATRALKEGDVLKATDAIEVGSDSSVDLAYDKEWNNVTRVEANSKVSIQSIYPIHLDLSQGSVYAKLRALPKDSTFEVKTPTAVATARGTEYRTSYEDGQTQVFNFSESHVYVFGMDSQGSMQTEPVIVKNSEKTQVLRGGQGPVKPQKMEAAEKLRGEKFGAKIDHKIQERIAQGRFGKIQDVKSIEQRSREESLREKQGKSQKGSGALVSREGEAGGAPDRIERMKEQRERFQAIKNADERQSMESSQRNQEFRDNNSDHEKRQAPEQNRAQERPDGMRPQPSQQEHPRERDNSQPSPGRPRQNDQRGGGQPPPRR